MPPRIARRAAECGVVLGGDIGIDMRRVRARTNAIVAASRNGLTSALENVANITLYRSHARFASPQLYLADRNILVDLPKDGILAAFGTPFKDRGRRGRQKPGNVFRDLPGHRRGRAPARVAQVVFRRGFSTW
jgi:hypothetical protein